MVRKGHFHYAVMSLLAAEHFSSLHPGVSIIARLPMGSYAPEHVLISRVPRNQIRRIGVDETSLDVMLLTDDEFQGEHNLEKVPVAEAQILDLLQEGLFDAIIWNRDGIQTVPDNVILIPLRGDVHKREMATQAVIIALQVYEQENLASPDVVNFVRGILLWLEQTSHHSCTEESVGTFSCDIM